MAVYTEVSYEELDAFLKDYDIGSLLSFKGIAEGVENSNYLLKTNQATFILTLYEKRVDAKDLPFFLNLMQHLNKRGLSCPVPRTAHGGESLGELAGRPAAVFTFLDGLSITKPQVKHCEALGRALAKLHIAGDGFDGTRPNSLGVKQWRPLFDLSKSRAHTVQDGLADEIDRELAILEQHWPSALPSGVIHADLFPDNVFFIGDILSGIIDFYFACNDQFAYDIAICLNAWCFEPDIAFNITKARALLRGYQSERPLLDEEKDALPLLARGAALRFLLTRLYDWLEVPPGALVTPHDPIEYWRKLRFHQAVKSVSEFGL